MITRTLTLCLMLALLIGASLHAGTRQPVVAGSFYPADSSELHLTVTDHLARVTDLPEIDGRILALIVPHAGLVYSGPIAAYSYKLLEGTDINRIILCGPSHRERFAGVSVYGPEVKWKTPLGSVPCDNVLCRQLIEFDSNIRILPEAHLQEHSLEVQLPYLQVVTDDLSIVPLVMGYQDPKVIDRLADALASLEFDARTVMVASSDWQHYRPAKDGWPMDSLGIACIEDLDPNRLARNLEAGRVEMCGGGPAVAVMKAAIAMGANRARILRYGDSGDAFGDKTRVVGYVAAVLYQSTSPSDNKEDNAKGATVNAGNNEQTEVYQLSDGEKHELLTIARQSILHYLEHGEQRDFQASDKLQESGAAFVTLKKNGRLRGCIGHTVATLSLYKTVASCAVSAAVQDPRFPPVKMDEVDSLHIEISVLTPLQPVTSFDEIEVGRDGLMIVKGNQRGLLLPQVATDYDWDRTTFIEQTCQKAGLPKQAYRFTGTKIYKFQALIFAEDE